MNAEVNKPTAGRTSDQEVLARTRAVRALLTLSPEATAAVVGLLQPASMYLNQTPPRQAWCDEVNAFAERLVEMLGGSDEFNRLTEKVGL